MKRMFIFFVLLVIISGFVSAGFWSDVFGVTGWTIDSSRESYNFGGMYGRGSGGWYTNPATSDKSCPDEYREKQVLGSAGIDNDLFYCYRKDNENRETLYDFGGMYGKSSGGWYNNPATGSNSCPSGYISKKVLGAKAVDKPLFFCYREHIPGRRPLYEFGGMYGKKAVGGYNNPATKGGNCPEGYISEKVYGTREIDYSLFYCYKKDISNEISENLETQSEIVDLPESVASDGTDGTEIKTQIEPSDSGTSSTPEIYDEDEGDEESDSGGIEVASNEDVNVASGTIEKPPSIDADEESEEEILEVGDSRGAWCGGADINQDGRVDGIDFDIWTRSGQGSDVNGDESIDLADFNIINNNDGRIDCSGEKSGGETPFADEISEEDILVKEEGIVEDRGALAEDRDALAEEPAEIVYECSDDSDCEKGVCSGGSCLKLEERKEKPGLLITLLCRIRHPFDEEGRARCVSIGEVDRSLEKSISVHSVFETIPESLAEISLSSWTLVKEDKFPGERSGRDIIPGATGLNERDPFHTIIRHEQAGNHWELRVGKGSQIYSIIVPGRGELISQVQSNGGQWIDTALQTAMTDQQSRFNEDDPSHIHQAGAYREDEIPRILYSPLLEENWDSDNSVYNTLVWPSRAHMPSVPPEIIVMQQIRDLGDGVVEVTYVYNNFGRKKIHHLNVPWSPVSLKKSPNVYISRKNGELRRVRVPGFNEAPKTGLRGTGGYFVLAEKKSNPRGVGFVVGRDRHLRKEGQHDVPTGLKIGQLPTFGLNIVSVVHKPSINLGETYFWRYYLVFGELREIKDKAKNLVDKVDYGFLEFEEEFAEVIPICVNENVGAIVCDDEGDPVFYSYSVPIKGSRPLFLLKDLARNKYVISTDPTFISDKYYDGKTEYAGFLGWGLPPKITDNDCFEYVKIADAVPALYKVKAKSNDNNLMVRGSRDITC